MFFAQATPNSHSNRVVNPAFEMALFATVLPATDSVATVITACDTRGIPLIEFAAQAALKRFDRHALPSCFTQFLTNIW